MEFRPWTFQRFEQDYPNGDVKAAVIRAVRQRSSNGAPVNFNNVLVAEKVIRRDNVDENALMNRVKMLFTESLSSPFLYPVWDVRLGERDSEAGQHYLLLMPELVSLRHVLPQLKPEEHLHNIFLPVAMALDTLHTPVPNRRSFIFHRDVCLDNVYMKKVVLPQADCQERGWRRNSEQRVAYDVAILKVTECAKIVFESQMAPDTRGGHAYYHVKDFNVGHLYRKEFDWYSFGIFVVEVLLELFDQRELLMKLRDQTVRKMPQPHLFVNEIAQALQLDPEANPLSCYYLELAKRCLNIGWLEDQKSVLKETLRLASRREQLYTFEYPVFKVAAELLCVYREEHGRHGQPVTDQIEDLCHCCMLKPKRGLPTLTFHSHKTGPVCDYDVCRHYCNKCYINMNRKFCLEHGTASSAIGDYGFTHSLSNPFGYIDSVSTSRRASEGLGKRIGHRSTFALICNGDNCTDVSSVSNRNVFAQDAEKIQNVLQDRQVLGLSPENVVRCDFVQTDLSCIDKLTACVNELKQKIHGQEATDADMETDADEGRPCANRYKYDLIIYYSGKGASEDNVGSWLPRESQPISSARIDAIVKMLWDCDSCNPRCARCGDGERCSDCLSRAVPNCHSILWIMDQCYPTTNPRLLTHIKLESAQVTQVSFQRDSRAPFQEGEYNSFLTYWLCELFTSNYREMCQNLSGPNNCCDCEKIEQEVADSGYITFYCLTHHESHFKNLCAQRLVPSEAFSCEAYVKHDNKKRVLVYHNEGGLRYRIFPLETSGDGLYHNLRHVDCKFQEKLSLKSLAKLVQSETYSANTSCITNTVVAFLTNRAYDGTRYCLVWDHEVGDILSRGARSGSHADRNSPVTLYYRLLDKHQQLKVQLGLSNRTYPILAPKSDYDKLITTKSVHQLPNLIVYVIHALYTEVTDSFSQAQTDSQDNSENISVGASSQAVTQPMDESDCTVAESEWTFVNNFLSQVAQSCGMEGETVDARALSREEWRQYEREASKRSLQEMGFICRQDRRDSTTIL